MDRSLPATHDGPLASVVVTAREALVLAGFESPSSLNNNK